MHLTFHLYIRLSCTWNNWKGTKFITLLLKCNGVYFNFHGKLFSNLHRQPLLYEYGIYAFKLSGPSHTTSHCFALTLLYAVCKSKMLFENFAQNPNNLYVLSYIRTTVFGLGANAISGFGTLYTVLRRFDV